MLNALSAMDTLNPYISTTNWDIRIIQKVVSMAWFSLFVEYVLITKIVVPFYDFYMKNSSFICEYNLVYVSLDMLSVRYLNVSI